MPPNSYLYVKSYRDFFPRKSRINTYRKVKSFEVGGVVVSLRLDYVTKKTVSYTL